MIDQHISRDLQEQIEEILMGFGIREKHHDLPDYVSHYQCVHVRKWIQFCITLGCGEKFLLFVGRTKDVLHFCKRMCKRTHRFKVQGIIVTAKQELAEIRRLVANSIRAAVQAIFGRPCDDAEQREQRRIARDRRRRKVRVLQSETIAREQPVFACSYRFAGAR